MSLSRHNRSSRNAWRRRKLDLARSASLPNVRHPRRSRRPVTGCARRLMIPRCELPTLARMPRNSGAPTEIASSSRRCACYVERDRSAATETLLRSLRRRLRLRRGWCRSLPTKNPPGTRLRDRKPHRVDFSASRYQPLTRTSLFPRANRHAKCDGPLKSGVDRCDRWLSAVALDVRSVSGLIVQQWLAAATTVHTTGKETL